MVWSSGKELLGMRFAIVVAHPFFYCLQTLATSYALQKYKTKPNRTQIQVSSVSQLISQSLFVSMCSSSLAPGFYERHLPRFADDGASVFCHFQFDFVTCRFSIYCPLNLSIVLYIKVINTVKYILRLDTIHQKSIKIT